VAKNYRELIVWQEAMDLVTSTYASTKNWPHHEQFGLVNQSRRAAVSIAANIAEGEGRGTDPDFVRFLRMAHGSLRELETHFQIAFRLEYLTDHETAMIEQRTATLGRQIQGLIRSLQKSDRRPPTSGGSAATNDRRPE
jgi:four helix bundle protein